jgi:acyl-coenzyme A synthetase/AMP-(fatty) acid ligase
MSMQFRSDNLYPGIIPHHARFSANEPAVVCGDQRLTWSQLELRTRKVANALAGLGVVKGDKVCIYMSDSVCSFELTWGIIRSGAVLVALNVMVTGHALATMIGSSDSVVLFADAEHAECIGAIEGQLALRTGKIFVSGATVPGLARTEEFIENGSEAALEIDIGPEDTMNIVYTSGTTGLPRALSTLIAPVSHTRLVLDTGSNSTARPSRCLRRRFLRMDHGRPWRPRCIAAAALC